MKLLIYFSVFLGSISSFAATTELRMFSADKKKYDTVRVTEYQGVKISESCVKAGKANCQAWTAVQNKIPQTPPPTAVLGNPAAHYCLDQKANNRILIDEKKREFDFCVFADGSVIDSWSLFNKHFGGK
ncbi:DUF333 domain-containing protein [Bdellovibrio svalbardensis]|uniref:DUF333 domain-containing protein n=1 Tax=Bdellovibrio svalbardensis TaxID=2972972 RepID=A0ABT6DKB3_9BACT|nr:DUF333 domain-containing protein [Bdellovibrio svalbardensis]MDG0817302.1 DUF333 domain-containing protein [Bdellovibrio svalbardensis]